MSVVPLPVPSDESDGAGGFPSRATRVRFDVPEANLKMQVRQLPVCECNNILQLLDSIDWPQNRRTVIRGKGICLGSTHHVDGPRIAGATRQAKMEQLCRLVNVSFAKLFPLI